MAELSQEEPAGSNQTLPPSPPSEDSAAKRRKLDPLDPQNLQVTMFPGYSRVPHTEHMFSFSDVSNAYYVSAAAAQICANIRRSAVSPVVAEDDSTFRDTIFVEPPEGPTLGVDFSGEWKLDVARSDLMDMFLDASAQGTAVSDAVAGVTICRARPDAAAARSDAPCIVISPTELEQPLRVTRRASPQDHSETHL